MKRHSKSESQEWGPLLGSSSSVLWTHANPMEAPHTAGKVQNLRMACQYLDGLLIPAGEVFSFWKQIGRTTKTKGFVAGREIREGCLIPAVGGGICQLSNALFEAALKSGMRMVERHAHSHVVPGSLAALGMDATVFWNYVDLRFSFQNDFRIKAELTKNHLKISFHGASSGIPADIKRELKVTSSLGDCHSCGITGCFRHQQQPNEKEWDHTAYLLDEPTPEFLKLVKQLGRARDFVFAPLDPRIAKSYAWRSKAQTVYSSLVALRRSWQLRRIPKQGAALQKTKLKYDRQLARSYAKKLSPLATHLVISINLLPHLMKMGVLGGRTYDVLMNRQSLEDLHQSLNDASKLHPSSPTIADFRAPQELLELEKKALEGAQKIYSAHAQILKNAKEKAVALEWSFPQLETKVVKRSEKGLVFFPSSALARKGIYELVEACEGLDLTVGILGKATEDDQSPVHKVKHKPVVLADLERAAVVVLPAHVEHNPRLLLKAIALGIPVIASEACGISSQKGVTIVDLAKDGALKKAIEQELGVTAKNVNVSTGSL